MLESGLAETRTGEVAIFSSEYLWSDRLNSLISLLIIFKFSFSGELSYDNCFEDGLLMCY